MQSFDKLTEMIRMGSCDKTLWPSLIQAAQGIEKRGKAKGGPHLVPVGDDSGLLYQGVHAAQGGRYVGQAHRVHKLGCAPQVCIHL